MAFSKKFLDRYKGGGQSWPWGYFIYIYRTAYGPGSNEMWNQALAKIHRFIYCTIKYYEEEDPEPGKIVYNGCKNVIIEDPKLADASPTTVRQLLKAWLKQSRKSRDGITPRSAYYLMIDNHTLQSILASPEPSLETGNWITEDNGYVILIDREFPDKGGIRHEPYNMG